MDGIERALALLDPAARDGAGPNADGYLDLLGDSEPPSTGPAQDLMLTRLVPRVYERWWRPALGRAAKGVFGPGMTDEKRIARLLLALSPGDGVLDIACGTGNFTRDFARTVQATLYEQLRKTNSTLKNLGVKQAPFMVLVGATMPSALAEISFMSNRAEATLLKTERYKQQIAEALSAGVMRYQSALKRAAPARAE